MSGATIFGLYETARRAEESHDKEDPLGRALCRIPPDKEIDGSMFVRECVLLGAYIESPGG